MNNYQKTIGAINTFYFAILFILWYIFLPYITGIASSMLGAVIFFILLLIPVILGSISSLMLYSKKEAQIGDLSFTEKVFFFAPFINELIMIAIFIWLFF